LDFSSTTDFGDLYISNNTELLHINLRNGAWQSSNFSITNNPQLLSVCVDDQWDGESAIYNANPFTTYTLYCEFSPAVPHNTLTGTVNVGSGGTCTIPAVGVPMTYSTGNGPETTFANYSGGYTVYPFGNDGNVTITPQVNSYFTVVPASYTSTFSGFGNSATANFCLNPNGVHPDLEIALLPLLDAKPGFDALYTVVVRNKGTQTQAGTVSLAFDDSKIDFVSADPAVQNQAANSIAWNLNAFAPFETRSYLVTFNVNSPMETPAVNNGDILAFTASLTTAETDDTPANNVDQLNQVVVGSYDPNDITVLEGATIGVSQTSDFLTYVVRFQNSGTAPATNVVVKDMVTANLNPATMQIVASSHPFRSTITEGNKLEFFFENIMLPAESVDEPGSHGFIAYKMKPQPTVGLGSVMEKTAGIFFDYNWPIVTNTAFTTVTALGTNNFTAGSEVTLYPNPVQNMFQVKTDAYHIIQQIEMYNVLGQQVMLVKSPAADQRIDISALVSGTYLVKVTTDKGKFTEKLMKL
jgi:uncharacterized repeat protein (TIGR01451 family)